MTERIDRAERLIPAAPERVFDAWTEAGLLAQWLPPDDARAEIETLDCRPGGALRLVLHFAPGTDGKAGPARDEVNGTFTAVDPPDALTLAIAFPSDDPAFSGTMLMHWTFAGVDGPEGVSTRATVVATGVPPGIDHDVHEAALASSLSNLAALFARPH